MRELQILLDWSLALVVFLFCLHFQWLPIPSAGSRSVPVIGPVQPSN